MEIRATARAEAVVRSIGESGRDQLVMVLGTGCCDSTAPFLYDHYYPGRDVLPVGSVAGVPILAHGWLAKLYSEGPALEVDVEEGIPNESLSLESEQDCRFTLRLRDGPEHPGSP